MRGVSAGTQSVSHGDHGLLLHLGNSSLVGEHSSQVGPPVSILVVPAALGTEGQRLRSQSRGSWGRKVSTQVLVGGAFTVAAVGILPDSSWKTVCRGSLAASCPVNLPDSTAAAAELVAGICRDLWPHPASTPNSTFLRSRGKTSVAWEHQRHRRRNSHGEESGLCCVTRAASWVTQQEPLRLLLLLHGRVYGLSRCQLYK